MIYIFNINYLIIKYMPVTINIYNNNGRYKKVNHHINTQRNQFLDTNRSSSCNAPFRMPLNLYRNTTTDCNKCIANTKVLKDNHAIYCCYDPYIKNILNKNGKISNSFIFFKKSFNYINKINCIIKKMYFLIFYLMFLYQILVIIIKYLH